MEILNQPVIKEKRPQGRPATYTTEYYVMMVKHILEEKLSYREAAKIYKVSHGTVSHWIKLHKTGKLPLEIKKAKARVEHHGVQLQKLEGYIRMLKAEVGELYLENRMLKKVRSFSQQQKSVSSSAITSENLDQWKRDAK